MPTASQSAGAVRGNRHCPSSRLNQTLIEKFQSRSDFLFNIAIMIAIENLIRINRDPIFHFQSDPARKNFFRILKKVKQIMLTLPPKMESNGDSSTPSAGGSITGTARAGKSGTGRVFRQNLMPRYGLPCRSPPPPVYRFSWHF
jgi:hypothetical protein